MVNDGREEDYNRARQLYADPLQFLAKLSTKAVELDDGYMETNSDKDVNEERLNTEIEMAKQ